VAITPYLLYRDAGAALTWLTKAFGLRTSAQPHRDAGGRVTHAEMKLGDALLMLGSPGPDFNGPKLIGHATQNLYVDVANVDRHYAEAVKAGARIVEEPKDTFYGARRYGAEDPEGHVWYFAQALEPKRKRAKPTARRKATPAKRAKKRRKRSSRR
jgi:PhnB protein